MRIEILARPAASVAKLTCEEGEQIVCEIGAMVAMNSGFTVETLARRRGGGGIMAGWRRMLAGENFFLNHFTATRDGQELLLGPQLLGDIAHHHLRFGSLIVQGTSWLASTADVDVDAAFPGLGRALLSSERIFWVHCQGRGDVLLSSFGAIYAIDVDGSYIVDTGHIVAFEDTLHYDIRRAGRSLLGSFLGGEGLVCNFYGRGRLYCQSHNPPNFGRLLGPRLHPR